MTTKEAYIHIQQGLQKLAAFVYADVKIPELDYFFNQGISKFIELVYPDIDDDASNPERRAEAYSKIQASVDDLRVLEVNSYTSTLTPFTQGGYSGISLTFPDNYRHLLNDRTLAESVNCNINATREVPNRLTKRQNLFNVLENYYHKTSFDSPVSVIDNNTIKIYNTYKGVKQFEVKNIFIDYLRKPTTVAYGVNGSTVLEFPDHVCFKIIEVTLIYISIVIEKNPNVVQQLQRQ